MSFADSYQSEQDALARRVLQAITFASYRAILGREPEPAAKQGLLEARFDHVNEASFAERIRGFIESLEFQEIMRARMGDNPADYPPNTWVRAEVDGLILHVDVGDRGVSRNCLFGAYEPSETAFVDRNVKPGMTFVDIGANIGWFSTRAGRLVGPEGKIISFEPRTHTYRALCRSMNDNGFGSRFESCNAALGATPGDIMIGWSHNSDNPGGTWTLPEGWLRDQFRNAGAELQATPVLTLDDVIGDRKVDFVKIDIEGAEPLAFDGASNVLKNSRPLIMSELNPRALQAVSNRTPKGFVDYMKDHGYQCAHLTLEGAIGSPYDGEELPNDLEMINVVFAPN